MATDKISPAAPERAAAGVSEFCEQHGISRAMLYGLWRAGKGPVFFKAGKRTLISREAAEDWRRRMERATAQRASQ